MEKRNEGKVGHQSGHDRPFGIASEAVNAIDHYLRMRGYQDSTRHAYLISVNHFFYWLEARPPTERRLNSEVVQIFLREHIPTCCCSIQVHKDMKTVRAALNQVLLMQGTERVLKPVDKASLEVESAIDRFNEYLQNVCGQSDATRWYHCRHIRMFLSWLFGSRSIVATQITPQTLCHFVAVQADYYCPGSMGVIVYSLRTYLKFLQFSGHSTPSVAARIPRPPNWSAASLPHALNQKDLALFLSAFDRSTDIGKRDYAMARCLTDLGLRCSEVANIQLNAIDWHNGILHLRKTKSRREDTLPIPDAMAKALAAYLRYGRPETNSRAVFVHHRAPVGQAVDNTTVRGAVRRAFARAGLSWTGTHILRNTVATRLLEAGASLKEIADILRHRSIDTTKSYTKIDLSHLSQVALPWPGRSL